MVLALLPLHLGVPAPVTDALFDVDAARPARPGHVADTFRKVVAEARDAGRLVAEDAALIAATEVLAEALDTAHRIGGMKGGYLLAQSFPPYQRALHALRLPVELSAASQPAPNVAESADPASWLRDAFGTPE